MLLLLELKSCKIQQIRHSYIFDKAGIKNNMYLNGSAGRVKRFVCEYYSTYITEA